MAGKGLTNLGRLDLTPLKNSEIVITIIFPKSTAKAYPMAVALSELADQYRLGILADKQYHLASFSKDGNQLSLAANILGLVSNITGVQAFIGGELVISNYDLATSLNCFAKSQKANNTQAYCECKSNYPGDYILPCRMLYGWEGRLSTNLPYSLSDQVQALAVSKGCDWCPNLRPEKIKKI
ncbi:hypothetical protein SMB94_003930 [Cronobacter sakazakii]|nr:hypothetical protein [Cronobacter sakazakii]ELY2540603.1 hypothetical protein [Cronobacter sakazakii]ELY4823281.1 hypothetical protein [Cronobacter sakazakii]ELY4839639.1 hypothetical protein [Cronobacter sakazakii]ELY5865293.1 hypothetical protein [Cronobacter sakazakii]